MNEIEDLRVIALILHSLLLQLICDELLNDFKLGLRDDEVFLLFKSKLFDVISIYKLQEIVGILELIEHENGYA